MPQIVDAQVFCANQAAGSKYTGAKMKYCPWCGVKLSYVRESLGLFKIPTCNCGTQNFGNCTAGCPVHGIKEFGV